MIRRPPRSTQSRSSAASDVYKRQLEAHLDVRLARVLEQLDVEADLAQHGNDQPEVHRRHLRRVHRVRVPRLLVEQPALEERPERADGRRAAPLRCGRLHRAQPDGGRAEVGDLVDPVSYTHLTLPTIY